MAPPSVGQFGANWPTFGAGNWRGEEASANLAQIGRQRLAPVAGPPGPADWRLGREDIGHLSAWLVECLLACSATSTSASGDDWQCRCRPLAAVVGLWRHCLGYIHMSALSASGGIALVSLPCHLIWCMAALLMVMKVRAETITRTNQPTMWPVVPFLCLCCAIRRSMSMPFTCASCVTRMPVSDGALSIWMGMIMYV